jgi:hypothetical protein
VCSKILDQLLLAPKTYAVADNRAALDAGQIGAAGLAE